MDIHKQMEEMETLANEADTSVHIFITGNQLVLIHDPFNTEEEVVLILNSAVSNLIARQALDKASGNTLQ